MDHMLEVAFHEAEAQKQAPDGEQFDEAWDEAELEAAWNEFKPP
jgi:hypothetical protein